MKSTAKFFISGGSRAVRLPAEFRIAGREVYVWRDEESGNVALSARPNGNWDDLVRTRDTLGSVPRDALRYCKQGTESRDPIESGR